jgi:hypothetical protein
MQLLLTTKRHFTIELKMPVRLHADTPTSLNGCGSPLCDVSTRALNVMEDIWSAYYSYYLLLCTLSAVTHRLNVSRDMLTWTLCLVSVCETNDPICPHISVTTFIAETTVSDTSPFEAEIATE